MGRSLNNLQSLNDQDNKIYPTLDATIDRYLLM